MGNEETPRPGTEQAPLPLTDEVPAGRKGRSTAAIAVEGESIPGAPHLRLIRGGRETAVPSWVLVCGLRDAARGTEDRALLEALRARRELGLYLSGLPGVGKSTFLLHRILEDLQAGHGCCVLDPHADLVASVLARCRTPERVVLFDPADTDWPIGLDLMDARTERAQDMAIQFMIDLYEQLFLPDHQGPMLHQSLRHGMRLVMESGGTLPEVVLCFTNPDYLKGRLAKCRDSWVRSYFERVWLKISEGSRGEHLAYFTSKLSTFLDDRMLRNILGQKGGVDLGEFLRGGGVFLANLARGAIGDLNARLLGMILLHKLERATLEQGAMPADRRRPIRIYVDEFHEFATRGLINFLGAARKFNVGLTLAHQRLETLPASVQEAVLGSIGHTVLFRQGSGEGLGALPSLVWPRFGERELIRLPNFHAVARVTGPDGRPRLGRLVVPRPGPATDGLADRIRESSRRRFARPRREVDKDILERLGWLPGPPEP